MIDLRSFSNESFDRGAPTWKESLWIAVKWCVFQTAIPWPSELRATVLRAFGARVGKRLVIRGNVNIAFPWRLRVGDDVWLGEDVAILSLADVTIESNVCISQRAFLCTGSHNFRSPRFDLVTKPIVIGRSCWIAAQSFIAPGVEIGAGSLVSAGSVVLDSVPPGTVVRGNPATAVNGGDTKRIRE